VILKRTGDDSAAEAVSRFTSTTIGKVLRCCRASRCNSDRDRRVRAATRSSGLSQQVVAHIDGLAQQTAGVFAQIDDQAFRSPKPEIASVISWPVFPETG